MAFRNTTITITGTCDSSVGEEDGDLDAFIAGLKVGGMIFGSKNFVQEGPEGVEAPALNALTGGSVEITAPNFTPVEGALYYLESSDNDWDTSTTISDNVSPNGVYYHTYNTTRKWRIVIHWEDNTVPKLTPGPSAGPVS
jgi:hypothetical protein